MEVLEKACLVDGGNGPQAHGNGWKLPVIRHQPGMRIGAQAVTPGFFTEMVHRSFVDPAFKKRTGVNTRRGVTLHVNQITATRMIRPAPEMIESHVVEGCCRGKTGNMTTEIATALAGP